MTIWNDAVVMMADDCGMSVMILVGFVFYVFFIFIIVISHYVWETRVFSSKSIAFTRYRCCLAVGALSFISLCVFHLCRVWSAWISLITTAYFSSIGQFMLNARNIALNISSDAGCWQWRWSYSNSINGIHLFQIAWDLYVSDLCAHIDFEIHIPQEKNIRGTCIWTTYVYIYYGHGCH